MNDAYRAAFCPVQAARWWSRRLRRAPGSLSACCRPQYASAAQKSSLMSWPYIDVPSPPMALRVAVPDDVQFSALPED